MIGGVRSFLLRQEQVSFLTPATATMAVPSPVVSFGPQPVMLAGSYTVSINEDGSYTIAINKTVG